MHQPGKKKKVKGRKEKRLIRKIFSFQFAKAIKNIGNQPSSILQPLNEWQGDKEKKALASEAF